MTTTHKHPYTRLTAAEMKFVDDCATSPGNVEALYYSVGRSENTHDYRLPSIAKDARRLHLMRRAQTMLHIGITPDNINDLYTHQQSGDTQTLGDWYDDYQCMDAESWHRKEDEDCHPENWIVDGHLAEVVSTAGCQVSFSTQVPESFDKEGFEKLDYLAVGVAQEATTDE